MKPGMFQLSLGFSLLLNIGSAFTTASQPPHIVFVLADDLGFNDVSYHGSEIQTPNLDKLANGGVRLENYYVQQVCSPTRSQLLSGRYQIHTGLQHSYIGVAQPNCLPTEIPILPQRLKNVGYATHIVGKWHLGFYKKACLPQNRGFDSFFGYHSGSEDYYTHFRGGYGSPMVDNRDQRLGYDSGSKDDYTHFRSGYRAPNVDDRGHWLGYDFWDNDDPFWPAISNYSVFVFNDRVNQIIDNHEKTKPLFLYLPFQSVHSPLQVPKKYQEPYKNITNNNRRVYAGMTSCMDEAIGNVVEKLKSADLWNNTVFVFSTDNGGQILEGGNNWPLRGWKTSYWEGGLRGVGFVHSDLLPSDVRGTINKNLIHVSDWLPTLVNGVAGYQLNDTNLDGFNMWDTIKSNKESPRKELLHNIDPWPQQPTEFNTNMTSAIRVGDWKLLTGSPGANNGQWIAPPGSGITPHMPLSIPGQQLWLFNITADPYEEMELSAKYPTVVKMLLGKLDDYYKDSVPVRFPKDSDEANPALHNGTWAPWE